MLEVGRICMKLAGRDAGQLGVIVDVLDNGFVVVDGQVRRRKCNVLHLEPTSKHVAISKGADHAKVVHALKALGIEVVERKTKAQKSKKPTQTRKVAPVAKAPAAKPAKAAPKAEAKPAAKVPAKKAQ